MKNYLERFKGKFSNSFQSMTSMSLKDKINLLEQLSNLLNSGIPITNALKIIILQTREKKKQEFLKNLVEMLNKGRSLKECFAQYPKIF
jgi:type II secretory pathway component PulF